MDSGTLGSRLLSGSLWSISGEVAAAVARGLAYFIYARLLSPADFGIVAFCSLIITLFPMVVDNAFAYALIREERGDQKTFSVIFFLNAGMALTGFALLCAAARFAAGVLHDSRVVAVLPVMGLQFVFNSLCATHMAVARRQFRFRALLPVRLFSALCSLAVGVTMALMGYSYWALAVASAVAGLSQMVAAWVLLAWHPSLEFDWKIARSVCAFASWVSVDMAVTWLVMSGGGFFLAYFLGAHNLGIYRLSDQIDILLMGTVFTSLISVFYSTFCEIGADTGRSRTTFANLTRSITAIGLIMAGGIAALAYPLEVLIGARWNGVADTIIINAAADGIFYLAFLIPTFLRAQGQVRWVTVLRIAILVGQAAIYSLTVSYGLKAFLYGKVALEVLIYVASYTLVHIKFAMPVSRLVGRQLLAAAVAVAAAAAAVLAGRFFANGYLKLLVSEGVFCLAFGAFVILHERAFVVDALQRLATRYRPAAVDSSA